jgi:nucleoside-diphosphate-sugar epimerase
MLWQAHTRQSIPVHRGASARGAGSATPSAIRLIIESGQDGPFNVGRDDQPLPMVDLARMACRLTRAPEDLITEVDPPANQTVVKRLATRRIRELGWRPQISLEEGILGVLDWVRRYDTDGNLIAA